MVVGNNICKFGVLIVLLIGLGCMSMFSGSYNLLCSVKDMVLVICGVVECGVMFFDIVEVYGLFINEVIVGEVL